MFNGLSFLKEYVNWCNICRKRSIIIFLKKLSKRHNANNFSYSKLLVEIWRLDFHHIRYMVLMKVLFFFKFFQKFFHFQIHFCHNYLLHATLVFSKTVLQKWKWVTEFKILALLYTITQTNKQGTFSSDYGRNGVAPLQRLLFAEPIHDSINFKK